VNGYNFNTDLKMGYTSADVAELQKILNLESSTAVALSGLGSKGNETEYFGELTRKAVIRFQEKYRSEILTPNGLLSGTGFVGNSTRRKLNSLNSAQISSEEPIKSPIINANIQPKITNDSFNEINPSEKKVLTSYFNGISLGFGNQSLSSLAPTLAKDALNLFPQFSKAVKVYSVDQYQIKPGQKVVISGTGFSKEDNVFIFGDVRSVNTDCDYSTYCEVMVPENLSLGEKDVNLENLNGKSSNQGYSVKVLVTNDPKAPSIINSITPNSINASNLAENIEIKGNIFSNSQNYIYTPLGQVGMFASPDGKSISFSIKNIKDIDKMIEKAKKLKAESVPIPFVVSNEFGLSDSVFINILINK
jgi:peptidoglycan hydrolase-like protein with peptidoglycan-binding domain